jgi:hypothetical protein
VKAPPKKKEERSGAQRPVFWAGLPHTKDTFGVLSGETSHLALPWLFGGSEWSFSATRSKHHLIFRQPLRAVAGALADLFRRTSAGCTTKVGVWSSTTCSVAVIEGLFGSF